MPHYPEIERLSRASFAFYNPIRHRQGYNEAAFQELCDAIRCCTARWSGAENVPKVLAWFLANKAFGIIVNGDVAHGYPSEEAERINKAAWTIYGLVNDCFVPPGDMADDYLLPSIPQADSL